MAALASLLQKYLGLSPAVRRLNYYSALGVDEFCDDRRRIAQAVEDAVDRLKSIDRTQDPEGFEQVVKVVRQARLTLLDSDKKQAYDAQLKATLRGQAGAASGGAAPSDAPAAGESERLSAYLPDADPTAPFSLKEFLTLPVDEVAYESLEARRAALDGWLATPSVAPSSAATLAPPRAADTPLDVLPAAPAPSRPLAPLTSKAPTLSARELQEQLRKNRQSRNMIAAASAILVSLLVLAAGGYLYLANRARVNERAALAKAKAASPLSEAISASRDRDDTASDREASPSDVPVEKTSAPKRMNLGAVEAGTAASGDKLPSVRRTPAADTAEGADDPMAAQADGPASDAPMPEATPPATMPDDAPEMMENQAGWVAAMQAARRAVDELDFEGFNREIDKALAATSGERRKAQYDRLNFYGQLRQSAQEAIDKGYAKLKAPDSLRYGTSGQVSVVEVNQQKLILRIAGKNQTFKRDQLPASVALAVAEVVLTDTAIDDAVRAIILKTHESKDESIPRRAAELFAAAGRKDPKLVGIDQVFDDRYE